MPETQSGNPQGNKQAEPALSEKKSQKYSIYIYHRPSNENDQNRAWERKTVTNNAKRARLTAKKLYQSDKYERVELQKTSFNENKKHNKIIKTYEERTNLFGRIKKTMGLFKRKTRS